MYAQIVLLDDATERRVWGETTRLGVLIRLYMHALTWVSGAIYGTLSV